MTKPPSNFRAPTLYRARQDHMLTELLASEAPELVVPGDAPELTVQPGARFAIQWKPPPREDWLVTGLICAVPMYLHELILGTQTLFPYPARIQPAGPIPLKLPPFVVAGNEPVVLTAESINPTEQLVSACLIVRSFRFPESEAR